MCNGRRLQRFLTVLITSLYGALLVHGQTASPGEPAVVREESIETVTRDEDEHRANAAGGLSAMEETLIKALDEQTDLEVYDAPIQEALDELAAGTGVTLAVEPGTMDLLPYGSRTTLSARIEDQSLRDSLQGLLWPVGLTFDIRDARLVIRPTDGLARIGRRATWDELATLQMLYSQPWSEELFNKLELQFQDVSGESAEANRRLLARAAGNVGAGKAAEVLTHACERYGWTWYPDGENLVILPKTKQIDRQLEKRVSLRYVQIGLREALLDLAERAGVLLQMDPGVFAELPPQTAERFSLRIENASIRQALEVVAGQTGLSYIIEPNGIRLTSGFTSSGTTMSATNSGTTQAVRSQSTEYRTNPIVGEIIKTAPDGTQYSFFIRQDDLPPEMQHLREITIKNEVVNFRRLLEAEQPQD